MRDNLLLILTIAMTLLFTACQSIDSPKTYSDNYHYLVIITDVKHQEVYQDYQSLASRIEIPGKLLAIDPNTKLLEGKNLGSEVHIIRFESKEKLMHYYETSNLKELEPMRQASSKSSYYIVKGI